MEDQQQENVELNTEEKIAQLQKLCEEYLNGWKRAKADLINYKNEESQRMKEFVKYQRENFILQILPMMDNLSLTANQMPPELLEDAHVKGLFMVKTQLEDFLKASGVTPIESVGKKFDPNFHDVIQMVESAENESGTIVEELEKGYEIDGHLLRPAKVKIAK